MRKKQQQHYMRIELELETSPQHHTEGKHLQAKLLPPLPPSPSLFHCMYVLYNVSVTYEAGGSWKVGDESTGEG